jgi:hypothetical protein
MPSQVILPKSGQTVTFVDRALMKANGRVKRAAPPRKVAWPPAPPPSLDYSRGRKILYPLLGNDTNGDCYAAAIAHIISTLTGQGGKPATWTTAQILQQYYALTGGADDGLDDDTAMGGWRAGWCGTSYRQTDWLVVPAIQPTMLRQMAYLYGGLLFTLAVPNVWINSAAPGAVWDAGHGVVANPRNGHAVHLSGNGADGSWNVETWGMDPPIKLTAAGVQACDPEFIVSWSEDWYGPDGKAPNGHTRDELAAWWVAFGGNPIPDAPPPQPPQPPQPTPPAPPAPSSAAYTMTFVQPVQILLEGGPMPSMTDAECMATYGMPWQQLLALILAILQGLLAQKKARDSGQPATKPPVSHG